MINRLPNWNGRCMQPIGELERGGDSPRFHLAVLQMALNEAFWIPGRLDAQKSLEWLTDYITAAEIRHDMES